MKKDRVPFTAHELPVPQIPIRQSPGQFDGSTKPTPGHESQPCSQVGAPSSNQHFPQPGDPSTSLMDLYANSEQVSARDLEKLIEKWGAPEKALSEMPMADQPAALKTRLLPYQRQGLAWMLDHENPKLPEKGSNEVIQLWQRTGGSMSWKNIATQFQTKDKPVLAKGGILADDMGLGKTLQVISCILEGNGGPTLIIAPLSVMSNWTTQIERHVKRASALNVLTYHGAGRKRMTAQDFEEYDVVISTYGNLAAEYLPRNCTEPPKIPRDEGIFSAHWERVVLDEGHTIRNQSTKIAKAATALLAKSRWVLSGTPIVNTIKDLGSMLKFLHIEGGLQHSDIFNSVLTRPLAKEHAREAPTSSQMSSAALILQNIMRALCLRRKKEMAFVNLDLPVMTEHVQTISFRTDEKKKYEAFE